MLQIAIPDIPEMEYFDERTQEFLMRKGCKAQVLQLEHSLISLSRWESKWKKPFLSDKKRSIEEVQDYIRCMDLNQSRDPDVYKFITMDQIKEVEAYISDSHTATTITDHRPPGSSRRRNETITSELIYYWMVDYEIPFECQKWHLNRLMTLIRICNIKNTPSKQMSKKSIFAQNKALNARRRAMLGSRG